MCVYFQLGELQSQCQLQAAQLEEALLKVQQERDLTREVGDYTHIHTYVPLTYNLQCS